MRKKKEYRLIWFQHIHKAAGSSIVQHAIANEENLYPQNTNGNPLDKNGRLIRPWDMSKTELLKFVNHCERIGVTFLATEWKAPDFRTLLDDNRIILITCLRDPIKRFISDYYYEFYHGYTNIRRINDYLYSNGIFTMPDYYCRVFSYHNDNPDPIDCRKYEIAESVLSSFHYCHILGKKGFFSKMNKLLNWEGPELHTNQATLNIVAVVRFILKGRMNLIWRRLVYPQRLPDNHFLESLRVANKWDYKLFARISEIRN